MTTRMAVFTLAQHAWQSMHWVDRIGDLAVRLKSHGAVIASATTLAARRGLPILVAVAAGIAKHAEFQNTRSPCEGRA
jgi:hypothetical protein